MRNVEKIFNIFLQTKGYKGEKAIDIELKDGGKISVGVKKTGIYSRRSYIIFQSKNKNIEPIVFDSLPYYSEDGKLSKELECLSEFIEYSLVYKQQFHDLDNHLEKYSNYDFKNKKLELKAVNDDNMSTIILEIKSDDYESCINDLKEFYKEYCDTIKN